MNQDAPKLDSRFLQPENWRWHHVTRKGYKLRFGTASPANSIPDAVVVCLQGVREFSEKYFEIAHWCLENNLAIWTIDWHGQGKSTRFLKNPHKRHAISFQNDIDDLHAFILEYVKHASVHPDRGRIPRAMLAHSFGAHIGLRYLLEHPDDFTCAAFSAPLVKIDALKNYNPSVIQSLTSALHICAGKAYILGGKDWGKRKNPITLSSDPIRSKVHDTWCLHDPELQTGDLTFDWVYHAQNSCLKLEKDLKTKTTQTPCLFGIPLNEKLVDAKAAIELAQTLPHAKILQYPDAYHELLMEKNAYRNDFLKNFQKMIKETIIDRPETLKPF